MSLLCKRSRRWGLTWPIWATRPCGRSDVLASPAIARRASARYGTAWRVRPGPNAPSPSRRLCATNCVSDLLFCCCALVLSPVSHLGESRWIHQNLSHTWAQEWIIVLLKFLSLNSPNLVHKTSHKGIVRNKLSIDVWFVMIGHYLAEIQLFENLRWSS